MKKMYYYIIAFPVFLFMVLLYPVSAKAAFVSPFAVTIGGAEYILSEDGKTGAAHARINTVRGENLPSELYIPDKVEYNGKKYQVKSFSWGELDDYFIDPDDPEYYLVEDSYTSLWKENITIPDKEHSYYACLEKITFAKGVDVAGPVYGYDKLKKVVFENPRNMIDARYNKCPKLKRLYLPDRISPSYVDIKNCPSLQVTIDKKNKKMKVIGKDVYSKNGMLLYNVVNGKKVYRMKKSVTAISRKAFWGNETIEKIYFSDNSSVGCILSGMPNLREIRFGKNMEFFEWLSLLYAAPIKRLDFPKKTRFFFGTSMKQYLGKIEKVYIRADSLKEKMRRNIFPSGEFPEDTTFYVKNKKVKRQLRDMYGFQGKIIIKKKMKRYDKLK